MNFSLLYENTSFSNKCINVNLSYKTFTSLKIRISCITQISHAFAADQKYD